jgi:hypothetical protein
MFFLFIIFFAFYFTDITEIILVFNENKLYEIKKQQTIDINTLDESKFFNDGILTYNNQKIIFLDFSNNVIWENQNRNFTDKILIDKDYVYRCIGNGVELIDKNNQTYMNIEISGEIIFVSRETNKKYIIADQKNGQNSLYIIDDNNEFFVDNRLFNGIITDISISDKLERYLVTTLTAAGNSFINTLSFNHLMVNSELWSTEIEDEIIMETEIINNNLLVIGTNNIYLFNEHGKLMWKNINYSNVRYYEINKNSEEIYLLFEKNNKYEIVCYSYDGKVKSIYKIPSIVQKLKIFNDKIFVYNENTIYLIHNSNSDKLFEAKESLILDFYVQNNNNIYILLKDKLIKGQIR